jgi:hypothetical protein
LFRAGKFNGLPFPIDPPVALENIVGFDAANHLTPTKRDTPFISVSTSLIFVLHKAYHHLLGAQKVAVIDGLKAHRQSRIYHCAAVLERLKQGDRYHKNKRYWG